MSRDRRMDQRDDHLDPLQDPVLSLHDLEGETGDDDELVDLFLVDRKAARELGVELDELADEPLLD